MGPFSTTSALYTSRHTSLPEDSFGARLHRPQRRDREQRRGGKDELEQRRNKDPNNVHVDINVAIDLTEEEEELFELLRTATTECGMGTTLLVAGG